MHRDRYVFLINQSARAIACIYDPENEKTEKATVFKTLDPAIKKDDLVVIPTNTRVGFTVVKVKEVDVDVDVKSDAPIAWIAGRFEKVAYDTLIANEGEAMSKIRSAELAKQRRELRDEMLGADAFEGVKSLAIADMNGGAKPALAVESLTGDPKK